MLCAILLQTWDDSTATFQHYIAPPETAREPEPLIRWGIVFIVLASILSALRWGSLAIAR